MGKRNLKPNQGVMERYEPMRLNIHYYHSREAPCIFSCLNGTKVWGLEQCPSIRTEAVLVSEIYVQNTYQITVQKET